MAKRKNTYLTQTGEEVQHLLDIIPDKVDKVPTATEGNIATFNGEGGIADSGLSFADIASAQPISYSDLAALRNSHSLTPGKVYRITDYVAVVRSTYTSTRSANHPFDIIAIADTDSSLSEECLACKHEGDTYFANTNFNAWKVRYCLDNDTSRFDWANVNSGKGVVYRLIDEWGNDLPYDFKGLQFVRWKVTASEEHPELSVLNGWYIGIPSNNGYGLVNDIYDGKWYYTFSMLGSAWSDDVVDDSMSGASFGNVFGWPVDVNEKGYLSNIVIANGPLMRTLFAAY